MAWHIVEKTIEHLDKHSTLAGKFWITFFFVFRFLLVISIADTIFGDDRGGFKCDTQTPGCVNVCFNTFSPISLLRYWALQLLCSALPGIILYVYVANKIQAIAVARKIRENRHQKKKEMIRDKKMNEREVREKQREIRKRAKYNPLNDNIEDDEEWTLANDGSSNHSSRKNNLKAVLLSQQQSTISTLSSSTDSSDSEEIWLGQNEEIVASKLTSRDMPPKVYLAYLFHVIARMIIEISFIAGQYFIYPFKFRVPERYECAHFERPCLNRYTSCYIDRPFEKTIFIAMMYGTSVFMILISLYELYYLGWTNFRLAMRYRSQDITKQYKINHKVQTQHLWQEEQYRRSKNTRIPEKHQPRQVDKMQFLGERVETRRSSISVPGPDLDNDKWVP